MVSVSGCGHLHTCVIGLPNHFIYIYTYMKGCNPITLSMCSSLFFKQVVTWSSIDDVPSLCAVFCCKHGIPKDYATDLSQAMSQAMSQADLVFKECESADRVRTPSPSVSENHVGLLPAIYQTFHLAVRPLLALRSFLWWEGQRISFSFTLGVDPSFGSGGFTNIKLPEMCRHVLLPHLCLFFWWLCTFLPWDSSPLKTTIWGIFVSNHPTSKSKLRFFSGNSAKNYLRCSQRSQPREFMKEFWVFCFKVLTLPRPTRLALSL